MIAEMVESCLIISQVILKNTILTVEKEEKRYSGTGLVRSSEKRDPGLYF